MMDSKFFSNFYSLKNCYFITFLEDLLWNNSLDILFIFNWGTQDTETIILSDYKIFAYILLNIRITLIENIPIQILWLNLENIKNRFIYTK